MSSGQSKHFCVEIDLDLKRKCFRDDNFQKFTEKSPMNKSSEHSRRVRVAYASVARMSGRR